MLRFFAVVSVLALAGCALPPSPAARLAESSFDLNEAARFGRMDVASELVRETAREQFSQHHMSWGRSIRIVDYEMGATKMRKDGEAEVVVVITWQRVDETTMRSTALLQRWGSIRGTWSLVSEEEHGGDPGLITELVSIKHDDAAPPVTTRLRFQEHVIYEQ